MRFAYLLLFASILPFGFQNCAPAKFGHSSSENSVSTSSATPTGIFENSCSNYISTQRLSSCSAFQTAGFGASGVSVNCMTCTQYTAQNGVWIDSAVAMNGAQLPIFTGCVQIQNLGSKSQVTLAVPVANYNAETILTSNGGCGVMYGLTDNFNCQVVPETECYNGAGM